MKKSVPFAVAVGCVGGGLAPRAFAQDVPDPSQPELVREIVVVTTRRESPAANATAAVTRFGPEDIERRNPFSVSDLLRETPGAYVSPDGPAGQFTRVFLRGAASNQTLVLVDGIPQNDATAGGLFDFGDLGMTGVERVEVLRGSYSVLYGSEAIGGVVAVSTRRGRGPLSSWVRAEGGSFGTRREEAGVAKGDRDADFAFAVGDAATDGDRDREEFRQHDAVGRFGLALTKSLRMDATLRVAQAHVESPFDFATSGVLPEDDNSGRRRQTISGGTTFTFAATDALEIRAVLSGLDVGSNFDNGPDGPTLVDPDFTPGTGDEFRVVRDELVAENTATDLRERIEATYTALRQREKGCGLGVAITAGGEHLNQRTISSTTFPNFGAAGSSTTRLDDTTRTDSLFAQAEVRLPDVVSDVGIGAEHSILTAGLRTDDHSVFGREGSPYVGARTDVLGTTLRASYGEGFRAPKPSELFDPFVGNADLGAETSESVDVGVSRRFLDGAIVAGVTWFRLRVDGLIAFDPVGFHLQNFARTETTGFEYDGSADLGRGFRLRGSYTTQNPRDLATGDPLANRARRFGSAGIAWTSGDWTASLDGFFSGGNPHQGGEFTDPDREARSHPGRRNLVDLTVRWQTTDKLALFGGLRNLLDDEWVATPNSPAGPGIGVYVGAQLDF